jgi:hypothetical protein
MMANKATSIVATTVVSNEARTLALGILRLNITISERPAILEKIAQITIINVVVRIPPAVDEGDAPMNISMMNVH